MANAWLMGRWEQGGFQKAFLTSASRWRWFVMQFMLQSPPPWIGLKLDFYLRPHPWLFPLSCHASFPCSQVFPEGQTLSKSCAPESLSQALLLGSLTHETAFVHLTHQQPCKLASLIFFAQPSSSFPQPVLPEILFFFSGLVYQRDPFELAEL